MRIVASILGWSLLLMAGLFGVVGVGSFFEPGGMSAALGCGVLALLFGTPGWLLRQFGVKAARRLRATDLVLARDDFTIDEIAATLRTKPAVAHAFVAQLIAEKQLNLAYREQPAGYVRRKGPLGAAQRPAQLAPVAPIANPAAPCDECGSIATPTDAGFCPTCGARSSARAQMRSTE
jgi:hypothetical protein